MAVPLESTRSTSGTRVEPTVMLRGATADLERGGRLQLDLSHRLQNGITLSLLGGVGTRRAGLLTGPPVLNPVTSTPRGVLPWVPRYAEYDASLPFDAQPGLRTQLGTGFSELTGDARAEGALDGSAPPRVRANAAIVPVGAGGVTFAANVDVHVLADTSAVLAPGAGLGLQTAGPLRVLDTRAVDSPLVPGVPFAVPIGAPAGARGVVASVAVVQGGGR
jgi:hypothetical protein